MYAIRSYYDLEKLLKKEDIFTFDVTTETCLSVAAILQFVNDGTNGVINVYPRNNFV